MKKARIKKHKLLLRHLTLDDYDNIAVLMENVYGNLGGAWKKDQYTAQLTRFPEGQIVIEDNGQLVAAACPAAPRWKFRQSCSTTRN